MKKTILLTLIIITTITTTHIATTQKEPTLHIYGEVNNPINITYTQFKKLPMTHINASIICVGAPLEPLGANSYIVSTHNWTGVKLKHLLNLTNPKQDAYDIVFRDNTQYSSSIHINQTNDNIIIAIYADNKTLTREQGHPYRAILPCHWGYKWVKYIQTIEITNYNHKGYWESTGYPDNGQIPNCTQQTKTNPKVLTPTSKTIITTGITLITISLILTNKKNKL